MYRWFINFSLNIDHAFYLLHFVCISQSLGNALFNMGTFSFYWWNIYISGGYLTWRETQWWHFPIWRIWNACKDCELKLETFSSMLHMKNCVTHLWFINWFIAVTQGIEKLLNHWSYSRLHWRIGKFKNFVSWIDRIRRLLTIYVLNFVYIYMPDRLLFFSS